MGQANIRLVVASLAILYIIVLYYCGGLDRSSLQRILICYVGVMFAAILLWRDIKQRPGVRHWRRLLAMSFDYGSLTYSMFLAGEQLLALHGVILWITVGNGLRFGRGYLLLATALALASLALVVPFTPFLLQHPAIPLALLITTLIVPGYIYYLLDRLQRALRETEAAQRGKSRFLAQASHDLRQPIHALGLFTTCLRNANLGAAERQLVDNVDRSLESLEGLFRSLLDIYTLDQERMKPQVRPLDLDELLTDVVQQNAAAASRAGVEIRLRPSRLQVNSDPALLTTVVQNLLSNAFKYAAGRPVLLGVRRIGALRSLVLYDQGRGIAAEHLPHLGEEFYRIQAERDRDIEGVGLGLNIVQRIATLLGLRLSIRSRLGQGTRVALEGLVPVTGEAPPRPVPALPVATQPLSGLRILLIEDEASVLLATATLLRHWGCEVQTATGIPQGFTPCDLVITDFDLDRTASGADCLAYLRDLQGQHVPAIVISGHDVAQVRRAIDDPRVPILSKPVRPHELRALLRTFRLESTPPATPA
ncbi:hybrid sensor histidine kinase/response regulator [Pseudomonas oryzihabitans]|nr:hybrid sensor histidine kinase/response regulator [Pseudomonas psychrotolerans]